MSEFNKYIDVRSSITAISSDKNRDKCITILQE